MHYYVIALCLFRVLPASVYFVFEWVFLLNANYGTIMLFNAGQQVFLGYDMTISHLKLLINYNHLLVGLSHEL
jgi:hypothetical protein